MESQKLEDLLLLSLNVTEAERMQSEELSTGFNPDSKRWELIIKYHGPVSALEDEQVYVEPLINGYAILSIPQSRIEEYIRKTQIEYVEMPKIIFAEAIDGREESCILEVTQRTPYLNGEGVLIGIIDSGIDIYHEEFLDERGESRILGLWDQSAEASAADGLFPPEGFQTGVYYSREQINRLLQETDRGNAALTDDSGHGTAVASIAAGSRIGVAGRSSLLVVKMDSGRRGAYPRTTLLMRAVLFLLQEAQRLEMPVAINISYGNCYGDHQGSSLLERYLDNASEIGRNVICVGSGNEAASNGHIMGKLMENERRTVELSVGPYETSLSLQIWKQYQDQMNLQLISPGGEILSFPAGEYGVRRSYLGRTRVLGILGQPAPYSVMQENYFDFTTQDYYLDGGIWRVVLEGKRIKNGMYDMYLPSYAARSSETGFYASTPDGTFTIPSTAHSVLTVGAYRLPVPSYAEFSGRGFASAGNSMLQMNLTKPELTAPGVEVQAAHAGGGYGAFTGTSFSTPYVTGSAALLMEWGIVRGNDPYLYGQKCKAYLINGCRQLPGERQSPNARSGWGRLCVQNSFS